MALEKNIISPAEASGDVQAGFDYLNNLLPFSQVFPVKSNDGLTTVAWTPVIPGKTTDMMKFRAWDAEADYGKTSEATAESYTGLIPLSKMGHITERDLIGHVGDNQFLHDKAEETFTRLGQEAAARIELARITAMIDAKIVIEDNGMKNTYTFQRPTALSNMTPAKLWSDPTADPGQDITDWRETIRRQKGRAPRAVLTTTKVIDALRTNEYFIQKFYGRSLADSPKRLERTEVINVLMAVGDFTEIRMIDDLYLNLELDSGVKLPYDVNTLIPDSTFLMFPAFNDTGLGFTASGPTAEGQNPEYGINKSVNDGFVGAMFADGAPVKYDLWANGTMMPILQEAVSTAKASVL